MSGRKPSRGCHVVHDEEGRILALALAAAQDHVDSVRLTSRPIPGPGQSVTEIDLEHEHDGLGLHEKLEHFVVERRETATPALRRREPAS
jgi:hypothetical protein